MMALAGVKLETHASEPDALTTRPPQQLFLRVTSIWSYSFVVVCYTKVRNKNTWCCKESCALVKNLYAENTLDVSKTFNIL